MTEKFKKRLLLIILVKFPRLKKIVWFFYVRLAYLLNRTTYKKQSKYEVSYIGPSGMESFFGYYDKYPENSDGYILCHLSSILTSGKPTSKKKIYIALFHSSNISVPVFTLPTFAYNWQQGSRLQWVTSERFIFNDYDSYNNTYVSKLVCIKTKEIITTFKYPVQDIFKDEYFLTLNYDRLMALRPDYGYRNNKTYSDKELKILTDDGVFIVDMKSGHRELMFSLEMICSVEYDEVFSKALHKINHLMISPDGEHFLMLHRFFVGSKRFGRLLVGSIKKHTLSVLANYGMVSHYCWLDESSVLAYLRGSDKVDGYYVISINGTKFERIMNNDLAIKGDGHPTVIEDGFITDTYPDNRRIQSLMKYSFKYNSLDVIAELHHGFKFSTESRCDLHPRYSNNIKKLYFDSVYSGKRRLCYMDLNN
jgi:hypothetical protein